MKGDVGHEGVVLWIGKIDGDRCLVSETFVPVQETGPLFYRIPDEEVFRILQFVGDRGLVVPAQVHSHPQEAFHSCVDDERAFVRHENAISIVVPNFAAIPEDKFAVMARFYRLHATSLWRKMDQAEIARVFEFE